MSLPPYGFNFLTERVSEGSVSLKYTEFSDLAELYANAAVKTPCYIVDAGLLKKNLGILRSVRDRADCRILLAQKAFSMYSLYPLISEYLDGTTASGLYEARLGFEEFGGETHVFSPAYDEESFDELMHYCNHAVFNSLPQWERFGKRALRANVSCGLRINPEYSEIEHEIYNPCAAGSRLGIRRADFGDRIPDGVDGLHFHTMCEQNSDTLMRTLDAVEQRFGDILGSVKWVNFGGGHHITRSDYDIELLISQIARINEKYGVRVYLEPGEAVALNAGFLLCSVLEVCGGNVILDTSAACHMPDVLEMPYRPKIIGAGEAGELRFTYSLGAPTCLAGDVIGSYSFDKPLCRGDRLVFTDMAIYTMVKNNTFNGMPLPWIYLSENGNLSLIRSFGYEDFKARL